MNKNHFLDYINLGLIVIDKKKKINYVNEWIIDHCRLNKIDIENKLFLDIFPEAINNSVAQNLEDAVNLGISSILSNRLNSQLINIYRFKTSEDLIPVKLLISPFQNDGEKGALIQVIDNSQVVDRENFLIEQGKILDSERIRTSNSARLASLGEMAGGIAHEINNPLAIIKGSISVLSKELNKDEFSKDKIFKHIEKINKTTDRIAKIIVGIRNISRAPGEDDLEITTLSEILSDVLNIFSEKLKINGVDFKVDFKQAGLNTSIELLKLLFYQIFINLLNNSYDAIEHLESKWMQVEAFEIEDSLRIEFTDSGNGIPKDVASNMFVPFYTTKDVGKGTGLGLSTIYKIIQAHQGKIFVDHDCENTRFVIIIPKIQKKV